MHKIYVYGTLMPNDGRERVKIKGALYDLGWFPGVRLDETGEFLAEIIEVDDQRLQELDRYEGYYEDSPESSLYIRRRYCDGWIYEYNRSCSSRDLIRSGDWQAHKAQRERQVRRDDRQVLAKTTKKEEALCI